MSKIIWDKFSEPRRRSSRRLRPRPPPSSARPRKRRRRRRSRSSRARMEVNELSAEERAKMQEKAKPVIDKYTADIGADLVAEANAEIAKIPQELTERSVRELACGRRRVRSRRPARHPRSRRHHAQPRPSHRLGAGDGVLGSRPRPRSSRPRSWSMLSNCRATGAIAGNNFNNGARLAFEQINAAGGILRRQIEVVTLDIQTKPEVAKAALAEGRRAEGLRGDGTGLLRHGDGRPWRRSVAPSARPSSAPRPRP